ncbi:MAG: fasciclin domain-containing protein [Myxococcales bacterium]|nr:fasciclin domain-containing protein [Myxococcales bacterium]
MDQRIHPCPAPSLLCEAARFPSFFALVVRAGLLEELDGDQPFTVVVPTEAAFEDLPDELASALFSGPVELAFEVAEHHLLRGEALRDGASSTLQGESVVVRAPRIAQAKIVGLPRVCRNGLLVPIDRLLVPRWGSDDADEARLRRFLDDHAEDTMRELRETA